MNVNGILKVADIVVANERGLKHIPSRILCRTPYHHIMLYIGNGEVIDVTPDKGCHVAKLQLTRKKYLSARILRKEGLSEEEREGIARNARAFLGKGFSWTQILRGFARMFFGSKTEKSSVILFAEKLNIESSFCANMVAMSYHFEGQWTSNYLPEYAMPKDFENPEGFRKILEKDWHGSESKR